MTLADKIKELRELEETAIKYPKLFYVNYMDVAANNTPKLLDVIEIQAEALGYIGRSCPTPENRHELENVIAANNAIAKVNALFENHSARRGN